MGKCTITFEDDEHGINCRVDFDPPLGIKNNKATPAQYCALEKWQLLQQLSDEDGENE